MNVRDWGLPFRLGTTSYVVPDDLLANARFLAPLVQEMQLVLFDLPDGQSNLPSPATVAALAGLGAEADFTYTVHLLDDLRLLDAEGRSHPSLASACSLVARTQALRPWAWVGHLDGREVRGVETSAAALAGWQATTAQALTQVVGCTGEGARLAIENLEGYAPDFVTPVVAATAAARCVDVGHLWLDGHDPLPHLQAAVARLRVVHLHGVCEEEGRRVDHRSLVHMPVEQLNAVLKWLVEAAFDGVVTLEVFGEADFWSSLQAVAACLDLDAEAGR